MTEVLIHTRSHLLSLLVVVLCWSGNAWAQTVQQKPFRELKGKVVGNTGDPLPGANVVVLGMGQGVSCDDKGRFALSIPDSAIVLQVSFIGYVTERVEVGPGEDAVRSVLKIVLQENEALLGAAQVEAKLDEVVFKEKRAAVLDFEFLDDHVLMLISDRKGYKLEARSMDLTPTTWVTLSEKPRSFFRDCMGNVHVIFNKAVRQVDLSSDFIRLMEPYTVDVFERSLMPCVGADEENLYFKRLTKFRQRLEYLSFNKESKQESVIYSLEDTEIIRQVEDMLAEIALAEADPDTLSFRQKEIPKLTEREVEQMKFFIEQILTIPGYHPLFFRNDSLLIFDHMEGRLITMYKGVMLRAPIPIDHHLDKAWSDLILMDQHTGEFFVVMDRSGAFSLHRFDIHTGEAGPSNPIELHSYPEKLKAYRGMVWYIRQGRDDDAPALYREVIRADDK